MFKRFSYRWTCQQHLLLAIIAARVSFGYVHLTRVILVTMLSFLGLLLGSWVVFYNFRMQFLLLPKQDPNKIVSKVCLTSVFSTHCLCLMPCIITLCICLMDWFSQDRRNVFVILPSSVVSQRFSSKYIVSTKRKKRREGKIGKSFFSKL